MNKTFPQHEKLKSRKVIEQLFSEGKSIKKFPVKILFLPMEANETHQAAFAVPKRNFKLAVTRNKIKRQLREAYRLNKHVLTDVNGEKFALLILYIGKDNPEFDKLNASLQVLLNKIS